MPEITRKFFRWVFRDALTVRDRAIKQLQADRRSLELEIAVLRARSER